ncbi:hypothetical protein [Sphingopyxis sp. 113P3]|jgi:hypothetical protein|uniref:hypothetical protein n=1 Tax=Sphingopyxis sp. (strain 113P3) TaxID=292913 RepID=UPI0006AD4EB5|nr:hypothetical protein [Sphingopyxis sp. 113P3]ALC13025.1 hypothetical protein LH20_13795 [Sphingopyxis sp. 113P3]
MINWVLRGAVLLWALFFAIVGLRGIIDPASFTDLFGIIAEGPAANTVRADLSAFFLVAAGGAAVGALLPGWTRALLVPAALYGTALVGRLIGAASGDAIDPAIIQAMIIEALSAGLMIASWWILSRPGPSAGEGAADTVH